MRRSKLPLLCVFSLVDQPVADEHDAGLQHKEINPLIQNQSRLITESKSVTSCTLLRGRSFIWAQIVMSLNELDWNLANYLATLANVSDTQMAVVMVTLYIW